MGNKWGGIIVIMESVSPMLYSNPFALDFEIKIKKPDFLIGLFLYAK